MFTIYRTSSSQAAYEIYPSSLSPLGYGFPLWHPEPHASTGEPQIGDVGYVREGVFVRLFNINSAAPQHKVTYKWRVGFDITDPLPEEVFQIDERPGIMGPGRYPSRGVEQLEVGGELSGGTAVGEAGLSVGYRCKEVQGALLVLRSEAHAERLFDDRTIEEYMVRQHDRWCDYARDKLGHHRVDPYDIILVSGWVKAPADWATAAFSNTSVTHEGSLSGGLSQLFNLKLFGSRTKAYDGPRMERYGAKYPKATGRRVTKDQCIFVKRYKVKKRLGLVRVVTAGAGYHELPPGNEDGPDTTAPAVSDSAATLPAEAEAECDRALFQEGQGKVIDPLDALLDYILEVSDASCAIARDEDIESITGGDDYSLDFSTYLRKQQPPVVLEETYARVSPLEMVTREQARLERPRITSQDLRKWPHISMEGSATVQSGLALLPMKEKQTNRQLPRYPYLQFQDARDTATRQRLSTLSLNGELLAATWGSPQITIWRTSDGLRVQSLASTHRSVLTALAISPSGRFLVSGSRDRTAMLWDVAQGVLLSSLQGHTSTVTDVAFSPDGHHIATASMDGTVKFWSAPAGTLISTFSLGAAVERVVFHADGLCVAAMLRDRVVLYAIGAQIAERITIRPRVSGLTSVAFSSQGDRILVCAQEKIARVFSTDKGKEVLRLDDRGREVVSATFLPGGDAVATVSLSVSGLDRESSVAVQDSRGVELFRRGVSLHGGPVTCSPDGTFLVTTIRESNVLVLSAKSGRLVADFPEPARSSAISELRFLPDSRRLLVADAGGPIVLSNVADTLRVR